MASRGLCPASLLLLCRRLGLLLFLCASPVRVPARKREQRLREAKTELLYLDRQFFHKGCLDCNSL